MTRFWTALWARVRVFLALFTGRPRVAVPELPPPTRPHPWEKSYPAGLDWGREIPVKPLGAILADAVAAWPNRPCLEFLGRRHSYAEVGALVAKAAKGFQGLGVGKGVRVGLFLPNSTYYVICYYAIIQAGGTVVNFNPLYAEREVARQIRDSGARIMVTMNLNTLYPKIARCLEDSCLRTIVVCPMGDALNFTKKALFLLFKRREVAAIPNDSAHMRFAKLIDNDGAPDAVEIVPEEDIAVMQFTGGTTGLPKGAMLTHANLFANAAQTGFWARGFRPGEEKFLAVLPLFHVFGMTAVMNLGLMSGAEIHLLPRFKVAETLAAIDKEKLTVMMGVPTIYSAINAYRERKNYDLSSLRYCVSGGAPLPLAVKTRFETLTGCTLVEGYGLTEAGPVCTINPPEGKYRVNSAGLPLPATVVEIVSLDDPTKPVPLDDIGEICIAGPQVMAEYWDQETETRGVLNHGRLRTGDVGYLDRDGYLYIIDRIKDLIISGGFNVYPCMVEEAICLHPAVAEAAVCGVPDRHRGEIVKAFVKLHPGVELTGGDLRLFLRDKLAPFEIPRRVEFREDIPKTLLGKPLRRALVEEAQRRRAAREFGSAAREPGAEPTVGKVNGGGPGYGGSGGSGGPGVDDSREGQRS